MIKAIFFDVDNTLYGEKAAHAVAWEKVKACVEENLGVSPERWEALCGSQAALLCREVGNKAATHNRALRFLRVLEQENLPLRYAGLLNRLYWDTLLAHARPEPGVRECLRKLKQAGYFLGVGSNMTLDWQLAKLERLELLEYFSLVLTSEEAGTEKPDAAFFQVCARKAGVEPEEVLFIGDSLELDVRGAENAGMQALWYAPGRGDCGDIPGFSHYCQLQNWIPMV